MQCDHILGITVMKGQGDDELNASHVALQRKYAAHPSFVGLLHYMHDIEYLLSDTSEFAHMIDQANAGLYWEIHANQHETEPSVEVLAELTAALFNLPIGFRKINLSGCFTAGMDKGGGGGTPVDFNHSLQQKFCEILAANVDPSMLEGCMVCGYRSIIILYDPQSPFFTGQEHAAKKFEAVGPNVQNTFSASAQGSLRPTHAKNVPFDAFADYMNKRDAEIDKLVKKKAQFDQDGSGFFHNSKINGPLQRSSREMHDVYSSVCNYIKLKRVMKFEDGNWRPGSLAEWSDNQTTQQLVSDIEFFNRDKARKAIEGAGCKVRIVP